MPQPFSPVRRGPAGLLIVLLMALLGGCGQTPDDDAIRQALNRELQGAHLDALLDVQRIDDAERHRQDDDRYTVDVRYTLIAKQDLAAYNHEVKNDAKRDTMDRFAMLMALAAVRQQFGDFHKGETFKQERRISLERGKDGWVIPRPVSKAPPRS